MTNPKPLPPVQYFRSRVDYEPSTGIFRWCERADRSPQWNGKHAGKVAGRTNGNGHIELKIGGSVYAAHRVAWLMTFGVQPASFIDHIDARPSNNAIANLRLASRSMNGANRHPPRNNTSGFKGVTFAKSCRRWQAQISVKGHNIYLGTFSEPDEAARAYAAAAERYFGEFARAG